MIQRASPTQAATNRNSAERFIVRRLCESGASTATAAQLHAIALHRIALIQTGQLLQVYPRNLPHSIRFGSFDQQIKSY